MTPLFKKGLRRIISITVILFFLTFSGLFLLAFKVQKIYGDVVQQLGTTSNQLNDNIQMSFLHGYLNYYGAKNAKNIATGDRAAVVKDLMQYTKQYINSDGFKKKYESHRNSLKPREPRLETLTKEDIRKKQVAEMEKAIKNLEETIKKNPAMEKDLRGSVDMFKNTLKDYNDPNSKNIEMMYQGHLSNEKYKAQDYADKLQKWETDFPADYQQLVKKRLQKMVDIAKTVDYSAELKEVNKKKIFVKPEYERQSVEWKQMFRAGKSVMDPTVSLAQEWIKEIK